VLDLGTGTGSVARGLAKRGCRVTGLDPSLQMLDAARRLDHEQAVEINYVHAAAEETGLPDQSFDVFTAGQCWHCFDRPRAAAAAKRLFGPGG